MLNLAKVLRYQKLVPRTRDFSLEEILPLGDKKESDMTHRKDFCGKKMHQSNQIEGNMVPWGTNGPKFSWPNMVSLRFLRKNHVDFLRQTIFSDGILVPIVDFS
jgi:hypothetical protein